MSYLVCTVQQQIEVNSADRQVLVETGVLHNELGMVPRRRPAAAGGDAIASTCACSTQCRLLVLSVAVMRL